VTSTLKLAVIKNLVTACGLLFLYNQVFSVVVIAWGWTVMRHISAPTGLGGDIYLVLVGSIPFALISIPIGAGVASLLVSPRRWLWLVLVGSFLGLWGWVGRAAGDEAPIARLIGAGVPVVFCVLGFVLVERRRRSGRELSPSV
jgi:hypothetical protein